MTFMQPERLSSGFCCYVMQTTATEFRKFAEECEQLATAAQSERHRGILREMADAWKKLATKADESS